MHDGGVRARLEEERLLRRILAAVLHYLYVLSISIGRVVEDNEAATFDFRRELDGKCA